MFRYPGGKQRLAKHILPVLLQQDCREYAEPFFGAGYIGLALLEKTNIQRFVINDMDRNIYAIWRSIKDFPKDLIRQILNFVPTTTAFFEFKESLENSKEDLVLTAYKKIAVHQMSYSGLGTMAGGPIGGKSQSSAYNVDCRWNPDRIVKRIVEIHQLFKKPDEIQILNLSYDKCLDYELLYLDPPYYGKGNELYPCKMRHDEHASLARHLERRNKPWLLSYDDNNTILLLYSFANVKRISATYTINSTRQRNELLISNF